MKKTSIMLLLILIMSYCFCQSRDSSKIEEEYYGLKWGCSSSDLKNKYPDVSPNGTNDNGDEIYNLNGTEVIRMFFFGEDKLYFCRIIYLNCSEEKTKAIANKLLDNYGKFDNTKKGTKDGNEYATLTRHYSSTIEIECTIMDLNNSYGSSIIMVTYTNKELEKIIQKDRINKIQNDLEL